MGIHASPTCVMSYGEKGGAIGYLVGEENQGLAYMFSMMNHARLNVGLQGVALAEGAYQQAKAYALERVQGVAAGSSGPGPIIQHPDVRRMLLLMKALTEASRAVCYDSDALGLGELLTPIAKGWSTEIVQEVTSLAIQVHGGMGFIEETGIAQYARDARITSIYEGTTAIQANDFIGRKFLRDGGRLMQQWISLMREDCAVCQPDNKAMAGQFSQAVDQLESSSNTLQKQQDDPNWAAAAAVNFLMQAGTVAGAWQMLKTAHKAKQLMAEDQSFYQAKLLTAQAYMEQVLPRAASYAETLGKGSETIMALSPEQF